MIVDKIVALWQSFTTQIDVTIMVGVSIVAFTVLYY